MNGKIAHLPQSVRDQLNRRLDDGERHDRILTWLNSLPEVQARVASDFAGRPISKQNLSEWTQHSFRHWKNRQNALAFATQDLPEDASADACSTAHLTAKLVQWVALRFAASAHTLAPADDEPELDLRRLRQIAADIVALRRGDLHSRRIALEEKHLDLQAQKTQDALEKEFWKWTKRHDISEKLEDQIDRRREWHASLRAAFPDIAPYLPQKHPRHALDESSCPAALI